MSRLRGNCAANSAAVSIPMPKLESVLRRRIGVTLLRVSEVWSDRGGCFCRQLGSLAAHWIAAFGRADGGGDANGDVSAHSLCKGFVLGLGF